MSTPLLAAKLAELRQSRGISQKELADYLGITREAYSHYRPGSIPFSGQFLKRHLPDLCDPVIIAF